MAKPTSIDKRCARHGVMENIDASKHFRDNPELLDESSSEYVFNEDSLDRIDDETVAKEVGNGCLRQPAHITC